MFCFFQDGTCMERRSQNGKLSKEKEKEGRWTDGRTDRRADGLTGGRKDGRTDGLDFDNCIKVIQVCNNKNAPYNDI